MATDDATPMPQSCLGASGGMVSTIGDLRLWGEALGTGALLEPAVWEEANRIPDLEIHFADHYEGPGRWLQRMGFIATGEFVGKEGSMPGYESITMHSPSRRTTITIVSMKQPGPITPPLLFQALAMDLFGPDLGFGLTPEQALSPTYTGLPQ